MEKYFTSNRIVAKPAERYQLAFITFDVCKALDYTAKLITITPQDRQIILHVKKSLLYHGNSPWEKNKSNNQFDVTTGLYDGAETLELIGALILSIANRAEA